MRKQYQNEEIDTSQPAVPERVSVALAELAGEVREGLLALAVGTGLQVMAAMLLVSTGPSSSWCSAARSSTMVSATSASTAFAQAS